MPNVMTGKIYENITHEFSDVYPYQVGDYCCHDGYLYRCATATTGAWDISKWIKTRVTDELGGGSTVWDPVAATYDETATYGRGNHAIYDNKLYECKVDGTTGTFNAANWYQRKVRDELDDKYTFVIRSNEDLAAFLTNDTTYGNNYKNVGFAYGTYSYNGDVANYGSASNYRTIHGNNATVSITYTATSGSEVSALMKYTTWYDINLTLNFGLEFAPATDTTFTYFDNSKFDNCNITFSANAFSYYRSTKALSAFTNCTGMTNCNIDSVIASMDSCTCSSFSFMTAVANSVITNNIFSIGSSCTSSWTKTFILMTCNKDNIIFANNYISTKSGSKFYTFTGFSGYGQLENNTFNFNNIHCFGNFTGAQLTSCTGSGNVIKAALGADTTTSITSIGLYAIGPGSYKNFTVELSAPNQKIQAVCIASDKANLSNCKISCSSVSTTSTNIYGIFSQNYCGKLSDNEIGVTGVMNVYGIYVGNVLSNMPIERNHIVLMDTANTSTVTTTSTNLYGIKNNSTRFATIKDNVISCHIQTRNDSSGNLRTYGVIKGIVLDTSTLYARIFNNSLFIPSKAAADPAWTSYTPTAIEAGTNSSAKSAQVHGNIISIYGNTSGDTMTDKGWGTNPIVASGTGSDTSGNYIYNNYD